MITYDCYHGTSEEYGKDILDTKHFNSSSADNEWAGSGVYYFINLFADSTSSAYENAIKWARYKKRYPRCSVLKSSISVDDSDLLDLCDEYYQNEFHRFRTELFEIACYHASQDKIEIKPEYLDPGKLDCVAINQICERANFSAVIRQCYIDCLTRPTYKTAYKYPRSFIPNCTIFCLRDDSLIEQTELVC